MVGKAGSDSYGKAIIENLKANGVNTDYMETVTHKKRNGSYCARRRRQQHRRRKGANDDISPIMPKVRWKNFPSLISC